LTAWPLHRLRMTHHAQKSECWRTRDCSKITHRPTGYPCVTCLLGKRFIRQLNCTTGGCAIEQQCAAVPSSGASLTRCGESETLNAILQQLGASPPIPHASKTDDTEKSKVKVHALSKTFEACSLDPRRADGIGLARYQSSWIHVSFLNVSFIGYNLRGIEPQSPNSANHSSVLVKETAPCKFTDSKISLIEQQVKWLQIPVSNLSSKLMIALEA